MKRKSKMTDIFSQRDQIHELHDWLLIYRMGYRIAVAGWIVTMVGFMILLCK